MACCISGLGFSAGLAAFHVQHTLDGAFRHLNRKEAKSCAPATPGIVVESSGARMAGRCTLAYMADSSKSN